MAWPSTVRPIGISPAWLGPAKAARPPEHYWD